MSGALQHCPVPSWKLTDLLMGANLVSNTRAEEASFFNSKCFNFIKFFYTLRTSEVNWSDSPVSRIDLIEKHMHKNKWADLIMFIYSLYAEEVAEEINCSSHGVSSSKSLQLRKCMHVLKALFISILYLSKHQSWFCVTLSMSWLFFQHGVLHLFIRRSSQCYASQANDTLEL